MGVEFQKLDTGKPRLDLLPPRAVMAVGRVLEFGARKYTDNNWRSATASDGRKRYVAAALRHVLAYMGGERHDPETGEHHLAHAACCCLFVADCDEAGWGGDAG